MTEQYSTRKSLDLSELRQRLTQGTGAQYWRSLDELAQTERFQEMVTREFPEQASELTDENSRRNFLKVMGASLAFGGLSGCTIQPPEKIVPFVKAPEDLIPGKPQYFASAAPLGGVGAGILVESHMGRPTKIEGNPDHPGSLGATSGITQASILDLYDPDRSQVVKNAGRNRTWSSFTDVFNQALQVQELKKGAGLRILTGPQTSPTLAHQMSLVREKYPEAQWHQYEAANRDAARQGAQLAYGKPLNTYYDLSQADVIVSLDADFLNSGPGQERYARDFGARRRSARDGGKGNRLYQAEITPTATGSLADHRYALSASHIEGLAVALAQQLGVRWQGANGAQALEAKWLAALVRDLQQHKGSSAVIVGHQQAPAVHALAHAINQALGNIGKTVHLSAPLEVESVDQTQSIGELAGAINAGEVDLLLILEGNPVYDAPADIDFATALQKVSLRVHLGLHENETAQLCQWHLPASHYLEAWSDIRAYDGTLSLIQPLVQPLFNTKSLHEFIGFISGQPGVPGYDIVRQAWEEGAVDALRRSGSFEANWRKALHDGAVASSRLPTQKPALQSLSLPNNVAIPLEDEAIELALRPDPMVWDGRYANNAWLQETPKPITKITWDNALHISPVMAERLGVGNEQIVKVLSGDASVDVPVWIVPGQATDTVLLHLGYGRSKVGRVGKDTGFDANPLRTSAAPWGNGKVQVIKSFERYPIACTQDHFSMEGRQLARLGTVAQFAGDKDFVRKMEPQFMGIIKEHFGREPTLYEPHEPSRYGWGMVIDLNTCTGCNACAIACQAENNIPVVGKEQVLIGREMSWIRIDRYFSDLDDPTIYNLPVPCMQCENAPCETVCPVGATVHSDEGLNDMAYNRCVGTRYCANNCPYKVRRFNFLQYADRESPTLKLQRNPDVTVRSRGVMEKCTYCTQRINAARIESKKAGTRIEDGDIVVACQQACPTGSISFGDINNPKSEVSRLKKHDLNYNVLDELGTRPRTSYLAGLKNPNPELTES